MLAYCISNWFLLQVGQGVKATAWGAIPEQHFRFSCQRHHQPEEKAQDPCREAWNLRGTAEEQSLRAMLCVWVEPFWHAGGRFSPRDGEGQRGWWRPEGRGALDGGTAGPGGGHLVVTVGPVTVPRAGTAGGGGGAALGGEPTPRGALGCARRGSAAEAGGWQLDPGQSIDQSVWFLQK